MHTNPEHLRQPPQPDSPPGTGLREFAEAMAAGLPGWDADVRDLTSGVDHAAIADLLWDSAPLHSAFARYRLQEAAVLTGTGGARLTAFRTRSRDQVAISILRPDWMPADLVGPGDHQMPMALAVDRDPVRAAAQVQERILPRYEQAVWRVRVRALTEAADGIAQASARWDTLADSFRDADGRINTAGYNEGKAARNAAAWQHVETFLAHGHEVLAGVKATTTGADYLHGPISADLRQMRGIDSVLARAATMRSSWEDAASALAAAPPGTREIYLERAHRLRDLDGWRYADELSFSGAALARAAAHLIDRIGTEQPPADRRADAALTRSAPGPHRTTAAPAPVLPAQVPAAERRTR
ncbi:hypothetical protein ACFO3J_27300 [Streptomyces polygonati]|uniref:Uncharacterized protein n=1 Tax=Streptomyces polygonati TaxID=1617087 RepID=A0ABV8HT81_9ACTN